MERAQPDEPSTHLLELGVGRHDGHDVGGVTDPGQCPRRRSPSAFPRSGKPLGEVRLELVHRDAILLHRIAGSRPRDGVIVEGVEIDGHTVRSAQLVLTPVPAADRLGVVVLAHPTIADDPEDLPRRLLELGLLRQWEHRRLVGSDAGMEAQHHPGLVADDLLVIGRQEKGHGGTRGAGGGLYDVRRVALIGCLVEVVEPLARVLGVLGEVEVTPICDALELVHPQGNRKSTSEVADE